MFDTNLLNLQASLNNHQIMSKFKPSNFGIKFEHILMDILDNNSSYILKEELLPKQLSIQNQSLRHSDYQKLYNHEFTNPIIHYFNQCFQSKKHSDCIHLSSDSKTDIYYKNKNGSLNEISIKTKNIDLYSNILTSNKKHQVLLGSSGLKLNKWQDLLSQDVIGTIKMFFNRTYDNKNNKSPYPSKKNDNVKFLFLYLYDLYNLDNSNGNEINEIHNSYISGEINIINMKNMFNLLKNHHQEDKIKVVKFHNTIVIKICGKNAFEIKENITGMKKRKITIYINLDFIMFAKLIDFKIPLHLDSKCLVD